MQSLTQSCSEASGFLEWQDTFPTTEGGLAFLKEPTGASGTHFLGLPWLLESENGRSRFCCILSSKELNSTSAAYLGEHLGYKCPRQDFFPVFPNCATMERSESVACGLVTG